MREVRREYPSRVGEKFGGKENNVTGKNDRGGVCCAWTISLFFPSSSLLPFFPSSFLFNLLESSREKKKNKRIKKQSKKKSISLS